MLQARENWREMPNHWSRKGRRADAAIEQEADTELFPSLASAARDWIRCGVGVQPRCWVAGSRKPKPAAAFAPRSYNTNLA